MDLDDLPIGVMRDRDMLAACMMSAEGGSYGGWKTRKAGGVAERSVDAVRWKQKGRRKQKMCVPKGCVGCV